MRTSAAGAVPALRIGAPVGGTEYGAGQLAGTVPGGGRGGIPNGMSQRTPMDVLLGATGSGGARFADANRCPLRTARSGGTGYGAAWYGAANRRHGSGSWSDVCLCRHGMMPPVGDMRRRPDRAGGTVPGNCPARSTVPPDMVPPERCPVVMAPLLRHGSTGHGIWCRLRPARCPVPPNGAAQNRLAKARLKTGGGPAARRPDRAGGMVPPIGGTVWCRPIGRHGEWCLQLQARYGAG